MLLHVCTAGLTELCIFAYHVVLHVYYLPCLLLHVYCLPCVLLHVYCCVQVTGSWVTDDVRLLGATDDLHVYSPAFMEVRVL